MSEQIRENKMGYMPENKLLISMALPMMISMLVQAMYNIVDSIFVSRLSENALTAVSLAFPMQNLMIAAASGLGVGINAILSRKLGQKDFKGADSAADNGIFLEFIGFVLFFLIGLFLSRPFLILQAGKGEIAEMGIVYIKICTMASFGLFSQITFERLLQSTGKTFYAMITQTTGAVINIILDPIMIFGYLGFPKMGIAGAALATVTGQCCAAVLAIMFNLRKNTEIHISLKAFTKPQPIIIKNILGVGIPSIIMASIGSVMTFCMNKILIAFTSTAVAVFGVYFKLQSFAFMPVFGLNNGMVPIVSYNYGARNRKRITKTIKLSMIYAVMIMAVCVIIMQLFPDKLMMIFDASPEMLEMGVYTLRIISIHFIFAGISIVLTSVFQALGKGVLSMIISIVRQLVFLVPCAYILSKIGGIHSIWWCFPIAECVSIIMCLLFFKNVYDKYLKKL